MTSETQANQSPAASDPSRRTLAVAAAVLSTALLGLAVVTEPLTVALPVSATAGAATMMWSIDRIQAGLTVCVPRTKQCRQIGGD